MTETSTKAKKGNGLMAAVYDWVGAAVVALISVSILMALFFRVVNVSGNSMNHTLQNGERLLLSCIYTDLCYGDIVVVRCDDDTPLIKRVIGMAGDKIFINDANGTVYRNGEPLDEPYACGATIDSYTDSAVTVPEGTIFVLGDNREYSKDSRSPSVGFVSMDNVVGVVTYRLSPFESLRNGE